ncbi:MAG: lamin tail domain-containing protein [Candidatus Nomurabacteria bacterium]|nr:lamin tail domain-containing protein [Candidatus Nomurabacteria bacterium]
MYKKILLVLVSIIFLSSFQVAFANVIINEVQIGGSDTNDEFIELYSSQNQDLTDWYIKRKTSSGAEYSLVSATHFKDKSINGYLLLAKDPGYTGNVQPDISWPSSYSLADDNSIVLYNGNDQEVSKIGWGSVNASDCVGSCSSNPTDGNSLQFDGTTWCSSSQTPKTVNSTCPNNSNGGNNTSGGDTTDGDNNDAVSSTEQTVITKPKVLEIPIVKTKITVRNNSFVNIPINFKGETFYSNGKSIFDGRYLWNFGDGDSRQVLVTNNEKFTHTYFYPGDYNVILEHYPNYFSDIPDATDRINIKIAPSSIYISSVGDEKDFFVELTNNSDFDADLSGWSLSVDNKSFNFSKNTIIPTKKTVKISSRITNFTVNDKNNLKLLSPTNEVVFNYGDSLIPKIITQKIAIKKTLESKINPSDFLENKEISSLDPEDFSASAINSNNSTLKSYGFFGVIFWIALVSICVVSVWFLRRRSSSSGVKSVGDEFELLDE